MANLDSQAVAIRDLLVEKLELFDPTLETAESSPLYAQVIQPIFEALGTDPFDTDIDSFLRDRLRQEFPDISVDDGDQIVDLLVRPVQMLLEAMKRETQIIRRGQSVRNADIMRLEDAEALAANFFTTRRTGTRTTGVVRVFYSAPTYVTILATVSFSTTDGLRYFPIRPQFFSPDVVLLQRSGTLYYVDVLVIAEDVGEEYNVGAGSITRVNGLSSVARVSNLTAFSGGTDEESARTLLNRTGQSLTERSLNTRRGIAARLFQDFPTLRNIEVVGYGDPEMNRDIITGGGQGRVVASGTCFIVGQFCVMFSQYEDRGQEGSVTVEEGDEIELNYWKFLYDVEPEDAHEVFTVENILFDSREIFTEDLPSVLLMQLSGVPSAAPPVALTLPGVLPGVFSVVRKRGIIEISNIPGGIINPDTARGTVLIEDGEVHVGGHYDIWARPTVDTELTTEPRVSRSESSFLEGGDLHTAGASLRFKNQVTRLYYINFSPTSGTIQLDEPVTGTDSGATARVLHKTATVIVLGEFGEEKFKLGETITGQYTGSTATITEIHADDWAEDGVHPGMLLSIINGNDVGIYKILLLDGPYMYLDVELTASEQDLNFRIISEVTTEIFNPKEILLPFGENKGEDLSTVIGSETVKTDSDLLSLGVRAGDSLEILEGDDLGTYTIASFGALAGRTPVLSSPMTSSDSGLRFRVFRPGTPLSRPLVRVLPGGIKVLDPSGQDSGNVLPYALPVEGRALEAFSGAGSSALGRNGFVLADPGKSWEPTGDLVADRDDFEDANLCFSEECLPCDGYIAVATFLDDGSFYLNSNLPAEATQFLQDLRAWVVEIIETFDLSDDFEAFVDGFHPFILGPPDLEAANILYQAEICIPAEIFDGCNNVFVAIPEFDWRNEFEEGGLPFDTGTIQFNEVLDKFNSGELEGSGAPPALKGARPGDSLTVLSGANAGSYIIDKTYDYKLCHGGAIQDEGGQDVLDLDKCYDVTVAVIKGSFPVDPFNGLIEFFENGVPELEVPLPPSFNVESVDLTTGDELGPFEVFEAVLTWIFQWLNAMGFDLPDGVDLDPGETLKALWQLLFHEYIVGQPTCEQMTRLTFIEPTSITALGHLPCEAYEYTSINGLPAEVTCEAESQTWITLPLPNLAGTIAGLTVTDSVGTVEISKALTGNFNTVATIKELAEALQALLDPNARVVLFSGLDVATGHLKVTTVKTGDITLQITAADYTDAFRQLGFYDDVGKRSLNAHHDNGTNGNMQNGRDLDVPSGGYSIQFDWSGTLGGANSGVVSFGEGLYTWEEIRAGIETQLKSIIDPTLGGGSAVDVTAVFDAQGGGGSGPYVFLISVEISSGTETWNGNIVASQNGLNQGFNQLFGGISNALAPSGTIRRVETGIPAELTYVGGNMRIDYARDSTDPFGTYGFELQFTSYADWLSYGFSDPILYALDPANHGDPDQYDALAQLLNSIPELTQLNGETFIQYTGGTRLGFRLLGPLEDEAVLYDSDNFPTAGWQGFGFSWPNPFPQFRGGTDEECFEGEGTALVGETVTGLFVPPEPTLFSAVTGAAELLYVASGNVSTFQVLPGETTEGRVPPTELPRDIIVTNNVEASTAHFLRFTDSLLPSPLESGVQEESDLVWLYEQRRLLERTSFFESFDVVVDDRVIAVTTVFGSNIVTLPSADDPDFNFLDSTTNDEFDEVQVGDVLFIEEGDDAGGYTVVRRSEFWLELDKAMTESSGRVFRSGNDGEIDGPSDVFRSVTAQFTEDDIGRFLTIWATNQIDYDGSYRILAVNDLGTATEVTLDTDEFPAVEQEIHWAVVKAPTEDPASSSVHGRTALVGVRPVRLYAGKPVEFRVANVSPHLDRTLAELLVIHEENRPPRQGVKQPFQVVRNGVQHISSTAMKGQGRELGLYYFDVLTHSFGGDAIHNIPEGTRMEPIFGTYHSEGYRLEVDDPNLVYSPQEKTTMVVTPQILPTGFTDTIANKVSMEGQRLRITYDYAPIIDQVQRLMLSEADRILCANPLARSFMPSYVYFDINISGGNSTAKIATEINEAIEDLEPVDDLDVSKLEKILNNNSVLRYNHPVTVIIVTHDLDRRLVGFRSINKIGEDEVVFNGSNRTTFFIPGPDRSSFTDETQIPDGERTYVIRGVPTTTLR